MVTSPRSSSLAPPGTPPTPVLPLADAQRRLGRPGRPQKHPTPGHDAGITAPEPRVRSDAEGRALAPHTSAHERRLLDLPAAAIYVSLSVWTLRELVGSGVLRRVRVPLPNGGELRRVLLDREDLDQLIARWKA